MLGWRLRLAGGATNPTPTEAEIAAPERALAALAVEPRPLAIAFIVVRAG